MEGGPIYILHVDRTCCISPKMVQFNRDVCFQILVWFCLLTISEKKGSKILELQILHLINNFMIISILE